MSFMNDSPLINIEEWEVQALAEKHYGTKLTDQECESIFHMFHVDFSKVGDSGWDGVVAHMVQAVITAIGVVIDSHRHMRNK